MIRTNLLLTSDDKLLLFYRHYLDQLGRIHPKSYERSAVERFVIDVETELRRRGITVTRDRLAAVA